MTGSDASRIESSLQVALPEPYRDLLTSFPVPAYAGNSDTAFWDDADRLIELNRELRGGASGVRAWPAHMFALGRDAGGCSQAIDLRSGELWWADRGHLDAPGSYKHRESLKEWATEYFDDLRTDLTGEGGDPSGTPGQREAVEERNARASARFSLTLLIAVLAAVAALVAWKSLR